MRIAHIKKKTRIKEKIFCLKNIICKNVNKEVYKHIRQKVPYFFYGSVSALLFTHGCLIIIRMITFEQEDTH